MNQCRTVMLIEADAMTRNREIKAIQDLGFQVHAAPCHDLAYGIAKHIGTEIDLAILDLGQAVSNGQGVLAHLQKTNNRPRILLTSGFCEFRLASNLLRERGFDFIQKPFTPDELAEKVKSILS